MKIAFCLFNYFPYGGLQRDFIRIARVCKQRGHELQAYTMSWEGEKEPGLPIHIIPVSGWQNHTRNQSFAEKVKVRLDRDKPHVVIGFNKMPYLDLYYAADVCYQSRVHEKHGFLYRLLPRYKSLVSLEKSIFAKGKQTQILLISPKQENEFVNYYETEANRFHILPPGIAKDRIAPPHSQQIRQQVRDENGIKENDILLLMVGSGFKTKGLDRAIHGLAHLKQNINHKVKLFVIGEDKPTTFQKLADQLKVGNHIRFLGGRSDVPQFLLAADLLIHPAYHENTGTVLLEAMISGLPVLTTDVCGYAHYITEANAGLVLASPFDQIKFNTLLQKMLLSTDRSVWQANGLAFSQRAEIYTMPERAVDLIEKIAGQKRVFE